MTHFDKRTHTHTHRHTATPAKQLVSLTATDMADIGGMETIKLSPNSKYISISVTSILTASKKLAVN